MRLLPEIFDGSREKRPSLAAVEMAWPPLADVQQIPDKRSLPFSGRMDISRV